MIKFISLVFLNCSKTLVRVSAEIFKFPLLSFSSQSLKISWIMFTLEGSFSLTYSPNFFKSLAMFSFLKMSEQLSAKN